MQNLSEQLKLEIEAVAAALGIAPSTVGERVGQGGQFYARLCLGKRVWPETAANVLEKLAKMRLGTQPPVTAEGSAQDALHKKAGAA